MTELLHPRRGLRLLAALATVAALAGLVTSVATAQAKPCGDKVVADWYDNGKINTIYPLHCYRDAIRSLPTDVIDYSNAKEEIGRALAFAKQGKPDPGGSDPTPGSSTSTNGTETDTTETTTTDTTGTDTSETDTTGAPTTLTAPSADTSGPSSVPVPLIVLGGLAVVLLAAGSAGYLRRRMSGPGDDDGTPPAGA